MKMQKTKTNDQMLESESGAISFTENSVQVDAPNGDKVAMLPEGRKVSAIPEGESRHVGIWTDDIIWPDPEETKGKDKE